MRPACSFVSDKVAAITNRFVTPVQQAGQGDEVRAMSSFNPVLVDRCLRKRIGQYKFCKPIENGNLLITVNQLASSTVDTLLKTKEFCNPSGWKIPLLASVSKPPGAKGDIYNALKDIADDVLLNCLKHQKVCFVRKFVIKNEKEKVSAKTVKLHFSCPDLPKVFNAEYLKFKVSLYIPKPLRCFSGNGFGHVPSRCRSKTRRTKCGDEHMWSDCKLVSLKCANCKVVS